MEDCTLVGISGQTFGAETWTVRVRKNGSATNLASLAFTAVATDLDRECEVWLVRGGLFNAIRASIAVPTVFRPHSIDGQRLVDGALLNPVPVTPLVDQTADYLLAVSVDGPSEYPETPDSLARTIAGESGYRERIGELFGRLKPQRENRSREPGTFGTFSQTIDLMQANLARLRLSACAPDLLIQLPRNVASVYEFYRARELIERGRAQARQSLASLPRLTAALRES